MTTAETCQYPYDQEWEDALQGRDEDERDLLAHLFSVLLFDSFPQMCGLYDHFAKVHDVTDDQAWNGYVNDWAPVGRQLAEVAGLPHDPKLFEQPWDMERIVRYIANPSAEASDDEDEILLNRYLLPMVAASFWMSLKNHPFEHALDRIRVTGFWVLNEFGPINPVLRRAQLKQFIDKIEWFRDTTGLHKPDGTVDVEAAARRAFLRGSR